MGLAAMLPETETVEMPAVEAYVAEVKKACGSGEAA